MPGHERGKVCKDFLSPLPNFIRHSTPTKKIQVCKADLLHTEECPKYGHSSGLAPIVFDNRIYSVVCVGYADMSGSLEVSFHTIEFKGEFYCQEY